MSYKVHHENPILVMVFESINLVLNMLTATGQCLLVLRKAWLRDTIERCKSLPSFMQLNFSLDPWCQFATWIKSPKSHYSDPQGVTESSWQLTWSEQSLSKCIESTESCHWLLPFWNWPPAKISTARGLKKYCNMLWLHIRNMRAANIPISRDDNRPYGNTNLNLKLTRPLTNISEDSLSKLKKNEWYIRFIYLKLLKSTYASWEPVPVL